MTAARVSFRWEGVSMRGEHRRGRLRAESREAALAEIQGRGLIPVRVEAATSVLPRLLGGARERMPRSGEIARVAHQLGALLHAGVPLLTAMRLLVRQQRSRALQRALDDVVGRVEAGATLSEALARHPRIFGGLFTAMVAAGEVSGRLDEVLQRLASGLERSGAVRAQVTRALFYPATILVIGCGAAALLLVFVVPAFAETFASFGAELPLPTRAVIALSAWLRRLVLPTAALLLLLTAAAWRFGRTDSGRDRLDALLLQLPLLGSVTHLAASARVAGTLGTLISSGAPLLEAIEVTARVAGNRVIEHGLRAAALAVRQGQSLAAALEANGRLPELMLELVSVAEQTGGLDQALAHASTYFEGELEQTVDRFTAALEPAAVLFLGITLGGLVIAMYLPVFKLGTLL